jgi:hypothetical protein
MPAERTLLEHHVVTSNDGPALNAEQKPVGVDYSAPIRPDPRLLVEMHPNAGAFQKTEAGPQTMAVAHGPRNSWHKFLESPLSVQLRSALEGAALLPPPFGNLPNAVLAGMYGVDSKRQSLDGHSSAATASMVATGASVMGILFGGYGKVTAEAVSATLVIKGVKALKGADEVERLGKLVLSAATDSDIYIAQLGKMARVDGEVAGMAVDKLLQVVRDNFSKFNDKLHWPAAIDELAATSTGEGKAAVRAILTQPEYADIARRFMIESLDKHSPPYTIELLEECIKTAKDTKVQKTVIGVLWNRPVNDLAAQRLLHDVLRNGSAEEKLAILLRAGDPYAPNIEFLVAGLSATQELGIRTAAASRLATLAETPAPGIQRENILVHLREFSRSAHDSGIDVTKLFSRILGLIEG